MKIKDILQDKGTSVVTIGANKTIHTAINELNRHGFGALIVTGEEDQIVGILTERDILQCCGETCSQLQTEPTREHALCQITVADVMTKDLVIGVPDDDIDYVMGVMTKHQIRHLPILDEGSLGGIISISDLVDAHLEENVIHSRTLKDYIHRRGH